MLTPPDPSQLRILLVEPKHQLAKEVTRQLKEVGFDGDNITRVTDILEALDALRDGRTSLCLAAAQIENKTVFNLMDEMTRRSSPVPVVVMAEDDDAETDRTALERGAYHFLVHGRFSEAQLERVILYTVALRQRENQLAFAADYDEATGLYNRRLFFSRLDEAILRADRSGNPICIVHADINSLRKVTEQYGTEVTEAAVGTVATRLRASIRRTDTAARIGGDEFGFIIENFGTRENGELVIKKLAASLALPIKTKTESFTLTACFGLAYYPEHGKVGEILLQRAFDAMKSAKRKHEETAASELAEA